ncbi:MAG: hypothetical protein ACM3TU_01720 [Bacillota bacterium]
MTTNVRSDCLSAPVLDTEYISTDEQRAYEDLVTSEVIERHASWSSSTLRANCLFRHLFGLPSPVIVVEFLSKQPEARDMVGCRMDARGLGLAEHLGIPVLTRVAEELVRQNVRSVALCLAPNRTATREHDIARGVFLKTGVEFKIIQSPRELPSDCYAWMHGKQNEFGELDNFVATAFERSIFGPFEYAQNRRFLIGINGVTLAHLGSPEQAYLKYPDGFLAVHLRTGRIMERYRPEPDVQAIRAYEDWYQARERLLRLTQSSAAMECLVQERRPVTSFKHGGVTHHEHRHLCFVVSEKKFKLVGGYALAGPRGTPLRFDGTALVRPLKLAA